MPYVIRTTKAGRTVEIEKYYTAKYNKKGGKRKNRVKATTEQQKKINTKVAERRIRLLMNENFGYGDYHVVLGYRRNKGDVYRTKEEMKKDIELFLRKLRKEYKRLGLVLKYIHVMEIGEKGARHHHLVINKIDIGILQECWEFGRPQISPLDETGQYAKLAHYFIKYTDKTVGTIDAIQGKRWNSSKNLRKPVPEYELISDRDYFRREEKVPQEYSRDYYIDKESVESGIHSSEYSGYGFYRFILVKSEKTKDKRKLRAKQCCC